MNELHTGQEGEPDQAQTWPEPTLDIVLRNPVTIGEETYDRLCLREPTAGEWEEIFAHPSATRRRYAVSRIAGVPMNAVKVMGVGDVVRAEAYLSSFFNIAQVMSVTSTPN